MRYSRPDVIDAIRYVARNGCVWRALPIDFPHPKLVYRHFTVWAADGTLSRINDTLREQVRVAEGRQPVPTGAHEQDRDGGRLVLQALRMCFPASDLSGPTKAARSGPGMSRCYGQ